MQAIYGFRNADHTIISRFNADFPDARVIELATNYRSRQLILMPPTRSSATAAPSRRWRCARPRRRDRASAVADLRCQGWRDEAEQIARGISDLALQGRSYREWRYCTARAI